MADHNKMLISVEEYKGLVIDREHLAIITDALWASARLNYNETELRFDSDDISTILKTLYLATYNEQLQGLKAEAAKNVGTDKD